MPRSENGNGRHAGPLHRTGTGGAAAAGKASRLRAVGARLAGSVLEAIFPTRCLICDRFFPPRPERYPERSMEPAGGEGPVDPAADSPPGAVLSALVCPACAADIHPVVSPFCTRCGLMFPGRAGEDHACGKCITAPKKFHKARSFGVYDGCLMALIHLLKYRGKVQVAPPLGRLLFQTFQTHWPPGGIDAVIPVPLHARRFRRRGFNQSHLMVRDWPKRVRPGEKDPLAVDILRDGLRRVRATAPQVRMDREARRANIAGAFEVSRPDSVSGRRILLVDDVYTTGATVEECAKVLLRNGAVRVDVLTLAQTVSAT